MYKYPYYGQFQAIHMNSLVEELGERHAWSALVQAGSSALFCSCSSYSPTLSSPAHHLCMQLQPTLHHTSSVPSSSRDKWEKGKLSFNICALSKFSRE